MDLVIKLGPVPNVLGPAFPRLLAELEEIDREQKEHHRMSHTEAIKVLRKLAEKAELPFSKARFESAMENPDEAVATIREWAEGIMDVLDEIEGAREGIVEHIDNHAELTKEIKDLNEEYDEAEGDREARAEIAERRTGARKDLKTAKENHPGAVEHYMQQVENLIEYFD